MNGTTSTTINFEGFPSYLTIKVVIDKHNDEVRVDIFSNIHVNKKITMPNTWSLEYYNDKYESFLISVKLFVIKRYGLKKYFYYA